MRRRIDDGPRRLPTIKKLLLPRLRWRRRGAVRLLTPPAPLSITAQSDGQEALSQLPPSPMNNLPGAIRGGAVEPSGIGFAGARLDFIHKHVRLGEG
jgi:hypothetical protein